MIKLELESKRDYKEGQTKVLLNLLMPGYKPESRHVFYEIVGNLDSKISKRKIWDHWPGEKALNLSLIDQSIEIFFNFHLIDIPGRTFIEVSNIDLSDSTSIKLSKEAIAFRLWYGHGDWPHEWSTKSLFNELKQLNKTKEFSIFTEYQEDLQDEYSAISFYLKPNGNMKIKDLYDKYFPKISQLHRKALHNLNEKFESYPFHAKFIFPNYVKHECEQYLSYFGQFLLDIGIESDTEIKRKGKEILFSVAPKDKNEAIKKINQAFSLFLTIPAIYDESIMSISTGIENQIKFQRMDASINHLKSQLRLAEATINAQQDHIHSLKDFKANILIKSLKEVTEKGSTSSGESYFHDIIKIKKYEGKGFEIDIPKAVSKIKEIGRKFIK